MAVKRTEEEIQADIGAMSRDNLGPRSPEAMRQFMLDLGATAEQAEPSVQFAGEENRVEALSSTKPLEAITEPIL